MNKTPPIVDAAEIALKKVEFQVELRNRFETQQIPDDIDIISEIIIDMTKQSASRVVKNKQQATENENIVTNTSLYDETTRNGGKRRR